MLGTVVYDTSLSYTRLQRVDTQIAQDDKWEATRVYSETESDEDERKRENDVQYQHNQPTGKDAYTGEKLCIMFRYCVSMLL